MSQALARSAAPSQLLAWLLEEPQLVHIVQGVDGATLARLVNHIGLEDSGELLALATNEQLTQLFDEDLFRPFEAGGRAAFDPDRFGAWLEVLIETGAERAAQRVSELDEDLLVLALCKHVRVVDGERARVLSWAPPGAAFGARMREALDAPLYREFDSLLVCSIADHRWTAFSTLLSELDRNHDDLLRRLLERCADLGAEDEEEQDYEPESDDDRVLDLEEMLGEDVAAAREERRERAGYVSPSDAMRFLASCRTTPLAELLGQYELDVASRIYAAPYFEAAAPRPSAPSGGRAHALGSGADVGRGAGVAKPMGVRPGVRPAGHEHGSDIGATPLHETPLHAPKTASKVAELLQAMRDAELLPQATRAALPGSRDDAKPSLLQAAMTELRESHQEVYERRVLELSYLANVLLAGCSFNEEVARPVQAAEAALAIGGLGLERALRSRKRANGSRGPTKAASTQSGARARTRHSGRPQALAPSPAAEQLLRGDLLQLFRVGFHVLHHEVAMPVARALESAARRRATQGTAEQRAEYARVADAIARSVERERPVQARPYAAALLDERAPELLDRIVRLLDPCPTGAAEGVEHEGSAVNRRFLGSERDLETVRATLRAFEESVKGKATRGSRARRPR